MARYENDFNSGVVGQPPSGFTNRPEWDPSAKGDFTLISDNTALSGKALHVIQANFSSNSGFLESIDELGQVQDVEAVFIFKADGYYNNGGYLAIRANPNTKDFIYVSAYSSLYNVLEIGYAPAGVPYNKVSYQTAQLSGTLDFTTWLAIRIKVTGGQIQAKAWQWKVEPEPNWQITYSGADVLLDPGYVGISQRYNGESKFSYLSVGTNGDPASLPSFKLSGSANVQVNLDGHIDRVRGLSGSADLLVDTNTKFGAEIINLSGSVNITVESGAQFISKQNLKKTISLSIDASSSMSVNKNRSGSANLSVNGQGFLAVNRFISGQSNIEVTGYGDLHGVKIPLNESIKVTLSSRVHLAIHSRYAGSADISVNAGANLRINRFASNFPPHLFLMGNNGIETVLGRGEKACPYFDPIHTEQLYNQDTVDQSQTENSFTFSVLQHENAALIELGKLIIFRDLDNKYQLFEIVNIQEENGDSYKKTIKCLHIFNELDDEHIPSLSITGTVEEILTQLLIGTDWQVGNIDPDLGTHQFTATKQSVLSGIAHLITLADAEVEFRVGFMFGQNGQVPLKYIDIMKQRGTNSGRRFTVGKDATRIHREVNDDDMVTALYGYGKTDDTTGITVDFSQVEFRTLYGDPFDKPLGQLWVGDPDALEQWGRTDYRNYGSKRHRFGSFTNEEETDSRQLLLETWDWLQKVKDPHVNYEVDLVELERISGYAQEDVRVGDTILIVDLKFQPVLRVQARILQIDRDLIDPSKTKVIIGNFAPTLITEGL